MRSFLIVAALIASPALSDECDVKAARIAAEVGGSVRARIGPAVKLQHSDAGNLSLECQGPKITHVSGSRDGSGSTAPFAQILARTTGLALGVTEQQAATVMLQCVRLASKKAGRIENTSSELLSAECYVNGDYITLDLQRR